MATKKIYYNSIPLIFLFIILIMYIIIQYTNSNIFVSEPNNIYSNIISVFSHSNHYHFLANTLTYVIFILYPTYKLLKDKIKLISFFIIINTILYIIFDFVRVNYILNNDIGTIGSSGVIYSLIPVIYFTILFKYLEKAKNNKKHINNYKIKRIGFIIIIIYLLLIFIITDIKSNNIQSVISHQAGFLIGLLSYTIYKIYKKYIKH